MWPDGQFRTQRCRRSSYRLAANCGVPDAFHAVVRPAEELRGSILAAEYEVIDSRVGHPLDLMTHELELRLGEPQR